MLNKITFALFLCFTVLKAFAINPDFNSTRQLSLAEIESRLLKLTTEAKNRIPQKEFVEGNYFVRGQYAVQQLQHYQGPEAIKLILLARSSYSDSIQAEALNSLSFQYDESALPVLHFLLVKKPLPPDLEKWGSSITPNIMDVERAAKILANHIENPATLAIIEDGIKKLSPKATSARSYLSHTLSLCHSLDCFELAKKFRHFKNAFEKANYYRIIKNFLGNKEADKMLSEAFQSIEHPVKEAASACLIGTTKPAYLPWIKNASLSMLTATRLNAIAALRGISHPDVFGIYEDGLLDSSLEVRVLTMSELILRVEPKARWLLLSVANGSTFLKIRTEKAQLARAPFFERMAELVRHKKHGMDTQDPSLAYMETFNASKRERLFKLGKMIDAGWTEQMMASQLLKRNEDRQSTLENSNSFTRGEISEDLMIESHHGPATLCSKFYSKYL